MKRVVIAAGLVLCWGAFAHASEGPAAPKVGSFSLEADDVRATVRVDHPSVLIVTGFVEGDELASNSRGSQIGVGVDVYVGDERCAIARDIRGGIRPEFFDDTFGATATCVVRLDAGHHILMARRVSPGVRNARVTLSWSVEEER